MQAQAIKADDQWSQYVSHNIGMYFVLSLVRSQAG